MEKHIQTDAKNARHSLRTVFFLLLLGAIALIALLAWKHYAPPGFLINDINLTEETALSLLAGGLPSECIAGGVEGVYRSCNVVIRRDGEFWNVAVIYDGLFDDSVRASKHESRISREGGVWIAAPISSLYKCQPGRGQQEFAPDLCI